MLFQGPDITINLGYASPGPTGGPKGVDTVERTTRGEVKEKKKLRRVFQGPNSNITGRWVPGPTGSPKCKCMMGAGRKEKER